MNKTNEAFVGWLKERMSEKGWSIREAARNIGLSHPVISNIVTYGEAPSYETCVALARAFGLPAEAVLRLAGLLPKPAVYNQRANEMIGIYVDLGDDDQEELLQMARLKRQRQQKKQKSKS